jgi:hypothetical protein
MLDVAKALDKVADAIVVAGICVYFGLICG